MNIYTVIACTFFISFINLILKKRKFRNHIKNCGILDDEKVRNQPWIRDLSYIREGLNEWEKTILKEELNKKEQEKEKEEMKQSRKEFFDKWKK